MGFAIYGGNLPGFKSFAHCERHAAEWRARLTKRANPIWGHNCLPLHNTRAPHLRMEWREDSKRWALMLYRTEVVGYFEDGRVLLDASYESTSTYTFLYDLSPGGIYFTRGAGGLRFYTLGRGDEQEFHAVRRKRDDEWGEALILGVDGKVLNPQDVKFIKTVANREKRKELRALLKPFVEWFNALTKVGNMMAIVAPVLEPGTSRRAPSLNTAALLGSDEMAWRACCYAAVSSIAWSYYMYALNEDALTAPEVPARVLKFIYEQVWAQRPEAFSQVQVTIPAGKRSLK